MYKKINILILSLVILNCHAGEINSTQEPFTLVQASKINKARGLALLAGGMHLLLPSDGSSVYLNTLVGGRFNATSAKFKDYQSVYSVSKDPAEQTLATGLYDGKVSLFDIESQKRKLTFYKATQSSRVHETKFDQTGNILAICHAPGSDPVKVYDLRSNDLIFELANGKSINCITLSPNARRLVVGYRSKTHEYPEELEFFDLAKKKSRGAVALQQKENISALGFSAGGQQLMAMAPHSLTVWDISNSGQLLNQRGIVNDQGYFTDAFFCDDPSNILVADLVGDSETTAYISKLDSQDFSRKQLLQAGDGFTNFVTAGDIVAALDASDRKVRIFDITQQ